MNADAAAVAIDFAVIGNARAALAWVRQIIDQQPSTGDRGRNGIVLEGLEQAESLAERPVRRLAILLEDPVQVLARSDADGTGAAGRYAQALAPLLSARNMGALVVSAEELHRPEGVARLVAHLGLASADVEPLRKRPPLVPPARRALLFARVRDDIEALESLSGRTFHGWRVGGAGPPPAPGPEEPTRLVYVGRRHDVAVGEGALALDEWQVLPVHLPPLLDRAEHLLVLDPMSFPFDALRESDREIPLAISLPGAWDATTLVQLLGPPLLGELTPFDVVSIDDTEAWAALRQRYSWPEGMRVPVDALGSHLSNQAVPALGHSREHKARFRLLRRAVAAQIEAAGNAVPPREYLNAVILARELTTWASVVPLAGADLIGVDPSSETVPAATRDFREWRFLAEFAGDVCRPEIAHVALSIHALFGEARDERVARLRELVRVLRVGGRLIVLDRFLEGRGGQATAGPAPRELLADVLEAAAAQLVLAHVESLRLPGDDLVSTGLFAFTRLGRPVRP